MVSVICKFWNPPCFLNTSLNFLAKSWVLTLPILIYNHFLFPIFSNLSPLLQSFFSLQTKQVKYKMGSVPKRRRFCFLDRNDGLASLAEMETGFSANHQHNHNPLISRPVYLQRRSLKNLSSITSPRLASGKRFYETRFDEPQPHFLEACFLCKKALGDNTDIFMYRLVLLFILFKFQIKFTYLLLFFLERRDYLKFIQ